jgi:oligosaccharide repeat unit polymerase
LLAYGAGAFLLFASVVVSRRSQLYALSPALSFSLVWVVAVTLGILRFGTRYISDYSVLTIGAGTLILCLGCVLGAPVRSIGAYEASPRRAPTEHRVSAGVIRLAVYAGSVAGLVAAVLAVGQHGFDLRDAFSLADLVAVGQGVSESRYATTTLESAGDQVVSALLGLNFASALVAPFIRLSSERDNHRRLIAAPLGSAFVYGFLTTEHLPIVLATFMVVASTISVTIVIAGKPPVLTVRRVALGATGMGVFVFAFTLISFVRVGTFEEKLRPEIFSKVENYALGSLPAFSTWLDDQSVARPSYARPELGYGTSMVPFIGPLTGRDRLSTRAYDDFVSVADTSTTTNIYTWWRNVLLDFGWPGGAAFLFLLGWLVGRLYLAVVRHASVLAAVGLSASYAVLLLSFTFTMTTFTNVFLSFLLAFIFVGSSLHATPSRSGATRAKGAMHS